MDLKFKRMSDESFDDYVWRICSNKDSGKYELTWDEVAEILNLEADEEYTSSKWRKNYQNEKRGFERAVEKNIDSDKALEELKLQTRELYKERQKFRDEKNEYSAWLREQSRMELFYERVDESVDRYLKSKHREIPKPVILDSNDEEIVASIADVHYGADFKIEGLLGDIIAEHNPEIVRNKMFLVRDEILDFSKSKNINKINLTELGDSVDGLIHLSQLQSLRGNVVDHILDYSDLFIDFIDSLVSEGLVIDVYTSEGNHSDLRLLTGKKGDFPNENLEKIFSRVLKKAYKNNPNVNVICNVRGINYFDVKGNKVLSVHGQDEKNIMNSISDYESTYGVKIDYLIVGHLHSKKNIDVNGGKEVIQVRSLMGANDFSIGIKKVSPSGALLFTLKENYGLRDTRDIKF